ncbi:MAG: class I SAM-dependent methyltransferase, partial [Planctomycetaceae bacterium]|nr:class I SAM-dependent methyltransferase [Planctomycetaceae bacterium]
MDAPPLSGMSLSARLSRQLVDRTLSRIEHGRLTLTEADRIRSFGPQTQQDETLSADIQVLNPDFHQRVVSGGSIGAAESFMDGQWESSDLTAVFRLFLRNESALQALQSPFSFLSRLVARTLHLLNSNSRRGSRRNIREHYDLGNDFFAEFLDPTMMYSSAIFDSPSCSLHQASINKLDRICQTLQVSSQDHLLEIGTGWGGFALHAAREYGCRVTTTTISREQFQLAQQRIYEAGLTDRITLLCQDYRDLRGKYDKLVSIEMIEAVGERYLPDFFRRCAQLIRSDGSMLIQAITMPEQRSRRYSRSVDFIQKHIFPGGYLPSITQMQTCASQTPDLRLLELRDYGLHYAET